MRVSTHVIVAEKGPVPVSANVLTSHTRLPNTTVGDPVEDASMLSTVRVNTAVRAVDATDGVKPVRTGVRVSVYVNCSVVVTLLTTTVKVVVVAVGVPAACSTVVHAGMTHSTLDTVALVTKQGAPDGATSKVMTSSLAVAPKPVPEKVTAVPPALLPWLTDMPTTDRE